MFQLMINNWALLYTIHSKRLNVNAWMNKISILCILRQYPDLFVLRLGFVFYSSKINEYVPRFFVFCSYKQMWLFVDKRQIKIGLKSLYSLNFKWIWFSVLGYNNNNNTNNKNGRSEDGESDGNEKNMLARKLSTKGDTLYLERRVGLFSGVALIVGTMIGKLRYNN